MRWRIFRGHRASDDGAWARSHAEELADKALPGFPGFVGGALLCGGTCARPQWKPLVELPRVA
jgi:hypothetical protein